jgi:hypothetical protein
MGTIQILGFEFKTVTAVAVKGYHLMGCDGTHGVKSEKQSAETENVGAQTV